MIPEICFGSVVTNKGVSDDCRICGGENPKPIVYVEDPDSESYLDLPREDLWGRVDHSPKDDGIDCREGDFDD